MRVSNPDRVYFPARGETKLDLVQVLPVRRRRDRARAAGAAVHDAPVPVGRRRARRCTRSGCRTVRRRGWRPCRSSSRGTTGPPTSCASPRSPTSPGRCRCRRSSSTPGTRAAPTPRSPTSGGSTSTRCPTARSTAYARVAHVVHEVLDELGAVGYPKTSGGSGIHVYVRVEPEYGFSDVRRAALAFAREVERRAPDDVTTTWWRKDRDPKKLFVDYNQNARDHTIASAYSVRGNPEGTVSTPITWDEIDDVDPQEPSRSRPSPPASPTSATCTPRSTTSPVLARHRCWSGPTATNAKARRSRLRQRSSRQLPVRARGGGGR